MAVEKWIVDAFENKTDLRLQTKTRTEIVLVVLVDRRLSELPVLAESSDGKLWSLNETGASFPNGDFRLLPPEPPPLEFWVNEYKAGTGSRLHKTADDAKDAACPDALRVAVHMREVVDD